MLRDRALPVVESERFTPRADGQTRAVRAERHALQKARGADEASIALCAGAAQANLQAQRRLARRIENIDICARVVREPTAVSCQVAGVVVLVVGVAAQVVAIR